MAGCWLSYSSSMPLQMLHLAHAVTRFSTTVSLPLAKVVTCPHM